jgi:hypothetical protein
MGVARTSLLFIGDDVLTYRLQSERTKATAVNTSALPEFGGEDDRKIPYGTPTPCRVGEEGEKNTVQVCFPPSVRLLASAAELRQFEKTFAISSSEEVKNTVPCK